MNTIAEKISDFLMNVAIVALAISLGAVVLQVIGRYIGVFFAWTEDLTVYPFTWCILLGAASMYHRKAHFKLDVLDTRLSPRGRLIVQIIICVLLLFFTIPMTIYGFELMYRFRNHKWITMPVKLGYTYVVMPLSGASMSFFSVCHFLTALKELRSTNKTGGTN